MSSQYQSISGSKVPGIFGNECLIIENPEQPNTFIVIHHVSEEIKRELVATLPECPDVQTVANTVAEQVRQVFVPAKAKNSTNIHAGNKKNSHSASTENDTDNSIIAMEKNNRGGAMIKAQFARQSHLSTTYCLDAEKKAVLQLELVRLYSQFFGPTIDPYKTTPTLESELQASINTPKRYQSLLILYANIVAVRSVHHSSSLGELFETTFTTVQTTLSALQLPNLETETTQQIQSMLLSLLETLVSAEIVQ